MIRNILKLFVILTLIYKSVNSFNIDSSTTTQTLHSPIVTRYILEGATERPQSSFFGYDIQMLNEDTYVFFGVLVNLQSNQRQLKNS